jgi:hypothetical protein
MATYKVTSNRLSGKKRGETVHADELVGVAIDALLAGGHLESVSVSTKKQDKKEQE